MKIIYLQRSKVISVDYLMGIFIVCFGLELYSGFV